MAADPKPLAECREEDVPNHHALVYGRVRVWNRAPSDNHEVPWRWSKTAWWKAMYFPHRGPPAFTGAWGVYAGGNDGYTGPGDAELTHFLPMPPEPGAYGVKASDDAQDARRYRQLRKGLPLTVIVPTPTEDKPNKKVTVSYGPNPEPAWGESLDCAVDAACGIGEVQRG